ncbi:MAG: hypothetical protein GY832_30645 [Chloroflexi bacterium]|nr:hypothetical protein [Chloroflexota bacterium]
MKNPGLSIRKPRTFTLGFFTFSFVTLIIAVLLAFATGHTILADGGPHGGYGNISGACAACHRTHTGSGPFVLYSAAQDNAYCYTCHNGTGASVPPIVSTHGNTDYAASAEEDFELLCVQCHDPHGAANMYTIRESVVVQPGAFPTRSGPVAFTAITGTNSYDDGLGAPSSRICVVCHSDTNNPGYPMDSHDGGANHDGGVDYSGQDCTTCHLHSVDDDLYTQDGFMASCTSCHGQPPNGGASPNLAASHTTHFAPIPFGPQINTDACDTCHLFSAVTHNDGQATFTDGQPLATTTACDGCHSPGGSFNGVNSVADSVGAKDNWASGVYVGNDLMAGKEKWCAGCHDDTPSVIGVTVVITAPNVIGDQDGNYTYDAYGLGWGYYKTGHGLTVTETYPASGGVTDGAGLSCGDCHDFSTPHIDGLARTFDDGDSGTTDPSVYRQSYRLNLVGGQEPMQVPWPGNPGSPPNNADRFRLCYSCHDTGPYLSSSNMNTNLVTGCQSGTCINRHASHLGRALIQYSSDWDGTTNSRMTCVVCHNVHGSTQLTMVRDGKLIGREPGLREWYHNDDIVTYVTYRSDPPSPVDVQLPASTGRVWIRGSSGNLCIHCHGGNADHTYRDPFQAVAQAPTLTWTGENGYISDGVDPDSAPAGSDFEFRIEYTDENNDFPSLIELWVDINDNSSYESAEVYTMTEAALMDIDFVDGKMYSKRLALSKSGDNTFNYRFYASGGGLIAPQPITRTVTVINNLPTLAWTEETYFEDNGVHPDIAANGSTFAFRIEYTDVDGDAPAVIQVWIDENENDSYDAGERHTMTAVSGDNATGMIYAYTATLTYVVDGVINYTFRANDGTADAAADAGPLSDNTVIVTSSSNNPPMLDWVSEACRTNGVKPARGLATGDFEFKVKYTDLDNQCPPTNGYVRVWIDEDDNSVVDAGETFTMTAAAGDCSSGKIYSATVPLDYNGDGSLEYQFSASDGTDPATGAPTGAGNQVTVVNTVNAVGVRKGSGDTAPWYNQIQSAMDAVSYQTIMVYEGVYTENLVLWGASDRGITLESVCGPDLTTISSASLFTDTMYIRQLDYTVIDGFSITGGSNGVNTFGIGVITVTDSIIRDNSRGIYVGNGTGGLDVLDTVIRNNSGADGGGIYFKGGGVYNVTNSTIQSNTVTNNGGGLYRLGGVVTIGDTTISSNSADNVGGGMYANGGSPTFIDSSINSNTSGSHGGGIYANTSATFIRSSISSNTSLNGVGGGAFVNAPTRVIILENSNLTDNIANTQAGGLYLNGSTAYITNSIVSGNSLANPVGEQGGGGIYANSGGAWVKNSIFWNNQAGMKGSGHDCYANGTASITFTYSIIVSGINTLAGSTGFYSVDSSNIEADPLFVGGTPYDYHLRSISPCIDAGTDVGAPVDDIDGDLRPQGAGVDIGSDEF